jgi:hypothetical protein
MGLRVTSWIAALTLVCALPARAQEGAKAAAVSAFDEARQLMEAGQVADACLKFGESQRLDPQLGTLLHLADCLEKNGQTASAWASFRDAAELAGTRGDARQALAEERATSLLPRLSKLQIEVDPSNDLKVLHVERGNVVVGRALWGAPIPTDPGPHTVKASSPGRQPWTGTVVVKADGSTASIKIPLLQEQVPTSPEASAAPAQTTGQSAGESPVAPRRNLLAERWPALVAGGVGLIGIGIGAGFGIKSMSNGNDAEEFCDGKNCTDPRGVELKKDAISAGNISTVAFIAGGVALAAGGVLWFTLPFGKRSQADQTGLLLGPGRVGVRGSF